MFKRTVLIIGGNASYERMFTKMGFEITNLYEDADFIQFTGGSDVSPSLYGQEPHKTTFFDKNRDDFEANLYKSAQRDGKVCLGICRGGQFLNVMNGGSLYQNVNNHAIGGTHKATDVLTGKEFDVTSTHHQMMIRHASGELVAYAKESSVRETDSEVFRGVHKDVEVVFYKETNSLCFQPHPEYYDAKSCFNYYEILINRFFFEKGV